jgi:hypothetical protein
MLNVCAPDTLSQFIACLLSYCRGVSRYVPHPPRSLVQSLGEEIEKYDQLCDAIEAQLVSYDCFSYGRLVTCFDS